MNLKRIVLGMGASLVSVVGAVPQLIWFSEHKIAVFIVAGLMLGIALGLKIFAADKSCPVDPELAKACQSSRRYSAIVFGFSVAMYLVGAFFAFVAPLIF
jgi:hypothetical protein